MGLDLPNRSRRLYPGDNLSELLEDFFPRNSVEVNGESFHKEQLTNVYHYLGAKPDVFVSVDAVLEREADNPFDANAVAVYIHEKKVGYVPKELAQTFAEFLDSNRYASIWASAALKYVSQINQFRVRLMVQTPLARDINNLMLVPAGLLPQRILGRNWKGDRNFDVSRIPWRVEYAGEGKFVKYAGPFPAIFKDGGTWAQPARGGEEDNEAGDLVNLVFLGTQWWSFLDNEYYSLVGFTKSNDGLCRTSVYLLSEDDSGEVIKFYFGFGESIVNNTIVPDEVYGETLLIEKPFEWANAPREADSDSPF
jgi:hypothetical protein